MLHHGDCREIMATLPPASIDAIVTDPPYGLGFMGKAWDESSRLASFTEANTRLNKYPRTGKGPAATAFDGAGFQAWSEAWAREAHRVLNDGAHLLAFGGARTFHRVACAIEDAGFEIRDTLCWLYGSGFPKSRGLLKPAYEPIILARKPAPRMTPLNIEACRIESDDPNPSIARRKGAINHLSDRPARETEAEGRMVSRQSPESFRAERPGELLGRWPANVVHDGLDESWARYFYCAKSSRSERNAGLDGMPERVAPSLCDTGYVSDMRFDGQPQPIRANHHPTVKPIALMRWLCRLVTPPGGTVLDPFLGSGSTGCAAALEGFAFIGIEQDAEYLEIARRRIDHWTPIIARAAD